MLEYIMSGCIFFEVGNRANKKRNQNTEQNDLYSGFTFQNTAAAATLSIKTPTAVCMLMFGGGTEYESASSADVVESARGDDDSEPIDAC